MLSDDDSLPYRFTQFTDSGTSNSAALLVYRIIPKISPLENKPTENKPPKSLNENNPEAEEAILHFFFISNCILTNSDRFLA